MGMYGYVRGRTGTYRDERGRAEDVLTMYGERTEDVRGRRTFMEDVRELADDLWNMGTYGKNTGTYGNVRGLSARVSARAKYRN